MKILIKMVHFRLGYQKKNLGYIKC